MCVCVHSICAYVWVSYHHDAFDPKAHSSGGADCIPPLHIPQLGYATLSVFLLHRHGWICFHHLLVQIAPQAGASPCLGYLLFQIRSEGKARQTHRHHKKDTQKELPSKGQGTEEGEERWTDI